MMGQAVFNDGLLVDENMAKPGYAYVVGGSEFSTKGREMSLRNAELYQSNFIRSKLGLERQDEMPPTSVSSLKTCMHCRRSSEFRCQKCRSSYCSKRCQRKDWPRHVFICAVPYRPNNFDRLELCLRKRFFAICDDAGYSQLVKDLFADDHICRFFGFINCIDQSEVGYLIHLYLLMPQRLKTVLDRLVRDGWNLGDSIDVWVQKCQAKDLKIPATECFSWFLSRRKTGFAIPNWEGQYIYQGYGLRVAEQAFNVPPASDDPPPLSSAQCSIMLLYIILLRPFNNIPDIHHAEWAKFGFCYCTSFAQREALASAYVHLVDANTPLSDVVHAWTTSSMSQLMRDRGVDVDQLEAEGILFDYPSLDEFGVYRLMAEVSHTLSGRFCHCFRPKSQVCHPKHETHLSIESDGDYGFHGTTPWERWQLLNFYQHVFQQPAFDPRRMLQARQSEDRNALEQYLETVVPDFRRKIGHPYLADGFFPKLGSRLVFPHGRIACHCVVHDTVGPEGLDWRASWSVSVLSKVEDLDQHDQG